MKLFTWIIFAFLLGCAITALGNSVMIQPREDDNTIRLSLEVIASIGTLLVSGIVALFWQLIKTHKEHSEFQKSLTKETVQVIEKNTNANQKLADSVDNLSYKIAQSIK